MECKQITEKKKMFKKLKTNKDLSLCLMYTYYSFIRGIIELCARKCLRVKNKKFK